MIRFFKTIADRYFPEKEHPAPREFHELEKRLGRARPKARPAFQRELKAMLRARHQVMVETRLEKRIGWSGWFYVHRTASVSLAVFLMVMLGTGGYAYASPAPKASFTTLEELEPDTHLSDTPFTYEFDRPMDRSSVEEAFSIEPAVDGEFIWEGRRKVYFFPYEPLDPSVQYTLRLSTDAHSLFQKPIGSPLEKTFQIVDVPLENIPEFAPILDFRNGPHPFTPEQKQELKENFINMEHNFKQIVQENDLRPFLLPPEQRQVLQETFDPLRELFLLVSPEIRDQYRAEFDQLEADLRQGYRDGIYTKVDIKNALIEFADSTEAELIEYTVDDDLDEVEVKDEDDGDDVNGDDGTVFKSY